MADRWYSPLELAGLPGMPSSKRRANDKLKALGVPFRPRQGREGGGGLEYNPAHLPAETQQALAARHIAKQGAAAVSAIAAPAPVQIQPAQLATTPANNTAHPAPSLVAATRMPPSLAEQRVADARIQLLQMVDALSPMHGIKRAYQMVAAEVTLAAPGSDLQQLASAANQRRNTLSARTLELWAKQRREGGWHALLPAPVQAQPLTAIGDDVAAVLGLYHSRDPQFRKLTDAVYKVTKQLGLPLDQQRALYSRARRALAKVDNVQLIKARHSGAERAAKLPFKRRDTSVLKPLDVWLMDGHTYKAKVRHPDHGQPFAPELTLCIDAATRRIMGWSVSLSENVTAVGDALRHGISQNGRPAILYSDNGAGETALAMDCEIDGFCARLGIDHHTGIPGHPQGHGLIERSWQTHAIKSARQFGSYQGKDADAGTFRKAAARIAKEQRAIKAAGDGVVVQLDTKLLPTWQQFIQAIDEMVHEYNSQHEHRGLPKKANGKHMTPDEAWAVMLNPSDQHMHTEQELRGLFMPSVIRTAVRGEVKFFSQIYYAPDLMRRDIDGHQVSVRYDIHDPQAVEVYTLDGKFVCTAKWGANKIDFFPKAVVEIAREKRVRATVKLREQQIDAALRELSPTLDAAGNALPAPGTTEVLMPTVPQQRSRVTLHAQDAQARPAPDAQAAEADARPVFFASPSERYEWLARNHAAWTPQDSTWLHSYVHGEDYEALRDYYASRGLDWDCIGGGNADGFKGARAQGGA